MKRTLTLATAAGFFLLLAPLAPAIQVGGGGDGGGGGGLGGSNPGKGGAPPAPSPVPGAIPGEGPTNNSPRESADGRTGGGSTVGGGGGGGGGGASGPPRTNRGPTPSTSGGASPPGAPGASAPGTSAGGGLDLSDWRVWWELNQYEYLQLKDAIWSPGVLTEKGGFYLGDGSRMAALDSLIPDDDQVFGEIAPALRGLLGDTKDPQVVIPALIGLAKLGEIPLADSADRPAQIHIDLMQHANRQIAEIAVLSLGLLGERDLLIELSSILRDEPEGRELVGRNRVPKRMRAFAAYAMGLSAERDPRPEQTRFVVDRLIGVLKETAKTSRDVPTACLNALSLVDMPEQSVRVPDSHGLSPALGREPLVRYLLNFMRDRRIPVDVRAHVPRTLARLVSGMDDPLRPLIITALVSEVGRARLSTRELRIGAVQALGMIGTSGSDPQDDRVRKALTKSLKRGDSLTRYLSAIAIAKVSSRPDSRSRNGMSAAPRMRNLLFQELVKGKSRSAPWAALALGVRGFHLREQALPQSQQVTDKLIELLERERSPQEAGAYAIALGLRGDIRAADVLRERLAFFRVDETRAHVALALGLVQSTHSSDQLHAVIQASEHQPYSMRAAAAALALMGDKSVGPLISQRMLDEDNSVIRARYAWSLAWIGDARAIGSLVAVAEDPDGNVESNRFAAIGLGWVGERQSLPWTTRLASDVNYAAAPSTLFATAGELGVLNLP